MCTLAFADVQYEMEVSLIISRVGQELVYEFHSYFTIFRFSQFDLFLSFFSSHVFYCFLRGHYKLIISIACSGILAIHTRTHIERERERDRIEERIKLAVLSVKKKYE